ncbi:MAG: type II toxin-antitoxin system VapC family toxin [Caldimonas sp.]
MIGLDTNVLARYIAQDDARQSLQASRLIEGTSADDPAFVSMVVLAELVWVLDDVYAMDRDELVAVVRTLLETRSIVVQSAPLVWQALRDFRSSSADFSDHLIARVGSAAGCTETFTFDRKAARTAGMKLVATP